MNQFKPGDIIRHVNSGSKYEVISQARNLIKIKDYGGDFPAEYFTLVQPFQPTMRTESVCIQVDNQEIAKIIWDFLLNKGYKPVSEEPFANALNKYIWVNGLISGREYTDKITCADWCGLNDRKKFNASTEFGAILDFFSKEPAPPSSIETKFAHIHSNGTVVFKITSLNKEHLDEVVSERNKFLATWAVYNNKNKK